MESFKRPSPEELLEKIGKLHRGRLKVYIGAVGGAGKTYHMLREGQQLRKDGIDVVACAVSTMRRADTAEQLAGLERIPSLHWFKDGEERKDLDMDAIAARNPEVVLVDGLAHRNRPGSPRPTRLEDIKHLLARGISVITTVNVYELEGMTELAFKLTGARASETVPSDALELADEVRLIDVTPETILTRLEEGALCNMKDVHLLKRGNLGKLRELALRQMAEDVNDSLEKFREEQGLTGPSGAAERILVCAQYVWNGSIYVRRGQQIARRLNGDLLVASFVSPRAAPTKEAAAFKRSIVKLAEKIGSPFEEVPLPNKRRFPAALLRYAAQRGVTRIVLGHSKRSPRRELWTGSAAAGILKRARNIDLFFVADRLDHEGERILPARNRGDKPEPYRRLSEREVEQRIERTKRGRFKVLIGAAPGVGKTYAMLREGNRLLGKGIDVAIGLLETHGRADTIEQIGELPRIPLATIDYRGARLAEMDAEAIIARNPEVALIDELAHTNVPGSRRRKRYEDVLAVLDAGISVVATVNVQHLESLNDAVEQITGVRVRETVPDSLLRLADEVELIDVAPAALRQRMRDGKIYAPNKVDQALANFFTTGNLIALRELALREIADDVDERLESWERNGSLRGSQGRRECIFVAIAGEAEGERLIRRGFRIAHRLKAEWHVLFVQAGNREPEGKGRAREEALRELTNRLGGRFGTARAATKRQLPQTILAEANARQATQLIVGHTPPQGPIGRFRPSLAKRLLQGGRHMDVLISSRVDGLGRRG